MCREREGEEKRASRKRRKQRGEAHIIIKDPRPHGCRGPAVEFVCELVAVCNGVVMWLLGSGGVLGGGETSRSDKSLGQGLNLSGS